MKSAFLALSLISIAAPAIRAQSDSAPRRKEIIYVEPTEQDYVGLILAATAWAKREVAKSLGVLQREEAPPAWTKGVAAAAKEHDLKTIALNDFTVVCYSWSASRSAPASRVCSMKGADAVLQFNGLRVAGDSAALVTSVTQVPKNTSRTETRHHCIRLARKSGEWQAIRNDPIEDPERCLDERLPQ